MKKVIVLFVTLIFSVLLLVSCDIGEPKSAIDVWNRIDKKMTSLSSYEARMDMSMKINVGGNAVNTYADSTIIEHNIGKKKDYYYYEETDMKITHASSGTKITAVSEEEYRNGNLFVTNSAGGKASKLYSPMTKAEFMQYKNSKSGEADVDFSFDKNGYSEFSQDEYGSWKIKFSEFSDEAIESISKILGVDESAADLTVEDIKFTIRADADFVVTRIDITFVFEKKEDETEENYIKIAVDYFDINEAEPQKEIPDISDYLEVDFKEFDKIDSMIDARAKDEEGSFYIGTSEKLTFSGNSSEYKEKNEVCYGEKDGKYFYEISSEVNNEKFTITYTDGTQQITREKGAPETKDQTDKAARAYIRSLINSVRYDRRYVTDIKKFEDGYTLKCNAADTTAFLTLFGGMGGRVEDLDQTVTIKVKDGEITEIKTEIIVNGSISIGASNGLHTFPAKVTIVSRIDFK